ncbi:MAG: bifunctional folylpolyglutamate synthase/dihydrofolate synthase [Peptococcaceae bacterium]|nr:bifunctional folylpolyglutamate synthase/dihydrofolate synthase [Peptococcaceae bacterium]
MSFNYDEAIEYLANLTKFGFNFGLERIQELLRCLGSPHRHLKVIHVGGTNGKGSTAVMVDRILREAGYRTGIFTSPHLHSYTERYRIDGVEIAPEKVAGIIAELRPHLEAMVAEGFEHPTEFEVGTALAFLHFCREKVDYLVLEVGLGGAIDSTNVITPQVAVITNVAMDHMDYLGHTVREIAAVKAGIVKPGVPLVTAAADPEALAVLEDACREARAPLIRIGRDVVFETAASTPAGHRFAVNGRLGRYGDLFLPLIGKHQLTNAATAVAAVEVLMERGAAVTGDTVRRALAAVRWPARLEVVRDSPLVIIDGAHNYDGARSLSRAIRDYYSGRRLILVLGMLGDKERSKVVAELAPLARAVVVTRPNSPRAGDWQALAREARRFVSDVEVIEDIGPAVERALRQAGPQDLVVITGSLYMVAEARELLAGSDKTAFTT